MKTFQPFQLGIILSIFCALLSGPVSADSETVRWDYEGEDGPAHWGDLDESFSTCEMGKNQSPIDLSIGRINGLLKVDTLADSIDWAC